MKTSTAINFDYIKANLADSIERAQYLLDLAKIRASIESVIANSESVEDWKAFKKFRKEADKAPVTNDQRLLMYKRYGNSQLGIEFKKA
jgi:hypothetical protein